MTQHDWRDMDRETRSAAYNNGAAVADSAARLVSWRARSAALRQTARSSLDLVYGRKPRNGIDLFFGGVGSAPLVVFIHGGYWQRNARQDFSCMAIGPLAHGCDVAMVGYTLAPEATLREISAEIRAALGFLRHQDAEAGLMRRMIVSGWSAGGHLAALSLGWPEVDGALAISGIYDLEPLRGTTIDDALHLTESEVADLSPIRRTAGGSMSIAYGASELPELCRQSCDYHAAFTRNGVASSLVPVEGADHFSVLDELISPTGILTRALLDLLA